jgi:septum formation topological specificity factor MinE
MKMGMKTLLDDSEYLESLNKEIVDQLYKYVYFC